MKLTIEVTVSETTTVVEVDRLLEAIEDFTPGNYNREIIVGASLVAIDDQPLKRLMSTSLKDFVMEGAGK